MFDALYREAYEKLYSDIHRLFSKLMLDNGKKSHAYRDGLTEACEAFLRLASESSGELFIALDREAEKAAKYFESESTADESDHEKQ